MATGINGGCGRGKMAARNATCGWGAGLANARFQESGAAQLEAEQVPKLKLKWAFGFPGAKAVYAFFSGTDAVNFVKQYDDFGLKQSIKLTGAGFLTEPDVLPAQGKSALGVITGHFYTPQLDSPTNRKFVADFKAKFANKTPDGFACQGYDTAEVIVRALKAVNGNTKDKDKLVDAIARVEFDSPRGRFRFDPKTHNVIQPFIYVREVKEVSGGLDNVPIDKIANVTDPGTGCTLPA